MRLDSLEVGDKACVAFIDAGKELKRRLNSFGILQGSQIEVKAITLQKNTYEIEVNRTMIALRKGEVAKIEVKLCDR